MIEINKTDKGYTVSTVGSNGENLSSTTKQTFGSKGDCWKNIRAQMIEWNTNWFVVVQDNTLTKPVKYRVFKKGKDRF